MKSSRKNFHVIQKKVKGQKNRRRMWIALGVVAILAVALLIFLIIYARQTYGSMEIVGSYENAASDNGNYIAYAGGILRYSRDGVALFDIEGEELWNQPCQIQSPIVEMCGDAAVLGDKDGTSVLVLQRTGIKGEFQTARPIEQLAVSAQGIVAAVLKDETTPQLVCYDAKGNVLVEQKASLLNTGYPLDIAISSDGETLLVSYLCINETTVSTDIVFYNFGDTRAETSQYEVARKTYEGQMIPTVAFLDENISVLISDEALILWEGTTNPKEMVLEAVPGEITQVAYNEKYISLVIENAETAEREVHMYNRKGQKKLVKAIDKDYANITMSGRELILYEEKQCFVLNASGIVKYDGELDVSLETITRISGLMRYIVAGDGGIYKIQLKK